MPPTGARSIRIGCSGWNYQAWKDEFYEGKSARLWLQHYAQHFDTVEVNNTFYRLPLKSSVTSWVAQTPPRFLFSVKASRYLTHIKRLTDLRGGIARYYERIEPLVRSPKLGPVLWQLPATFKRDDDRLAAALEAFPFRRWRGRPFGCPARCSRTSARSRSRACPLPSRRRAPAATAADG